MTITEGLVKQAPSTRRAEPPPGRIGAPPWPVWLGVGGLAAGAAATALAYALWIEPMDLRLERLTLRLPHAAGRLPAHGLRILHLSDTHFQGRTWREHTKIAHIRRLVQDMEIDLLIHTGDFLHFDSGVENVCALLGVLPRPRLGSYGVLGNHDYRHYNMGAALPRMWRTFCTLEVERGARANFFSRTFLGATRWLRYVMYVRHMPLDGRRTGDNDAARLESILEDHGMHLLHNRAVRLQEPSWPLDIFLAGVDDVTEGRPLLGDSLADVPEGAPVILLSHNPDILVSPQMNRVDVLLSGHTHGGQIKLPLWGPAHTQTEHLARAEVSGYFRRGRTHVYITRGVGEGIPLRFGSGPQIALITVTA